MLIFPMAIKLNYIIINWFYTLLSRAVWSGEKSVMSSREIFNNIITLSFALCSLLYTQVFLNLNDSRIRQRKVFKYVLDIALILMIELTLRSISYRSLRDTHNQLIRLTLNVAKSVASCGFYELLNSFLQSLSSLSLFPPPSLSSSLWLSNSVIITSSKLVKLF